MEKKTAAAETAAAETAAAETAAEVVPAEAEAAAAEAPAAAAAPTEATAEAAEVTATDTQYWQNRALAAEAELLCREREAALERGLSSVTFTSQAARRDVVSRIRAARLPLEGGELCGLEGLLSAIKAEDAGAFSDTAPVRFTEPLSGEDPAGGDPSARRRLIMAIRDRAERRAAIAENIDLFK